MTRIRDHAVSLGVGVAALLLLFAVIVAPDLVQQTLTEGEIEDPIALSTIRLAMAVVLAVVVLWWLLESRRTGAAELEPLVASAPESVRGRQTDRAGATVDAQIDAVLDRELQSDDERSALEQQVRATAIDLYAAKTGCSPDQATKAIDQGTWTDDERAAAFVAETQTVPFRIQFWDAVRPEHPYRRRLTSAVDAIEALEDGPREASE